MDFSFFFEDVQFFLLLGAAMGAYYGRMRREEGLESWLRRDKA